MGDVARAYLLGKLTESEVELYESRLVMDADAFAEVEEAEDDLFDAFARGLLDSDDRGRFLERYGHDRARRHFAEALARRVTPQPTRMPVWRQRWIGLAVAVTLLLVVGGAVLQRQATRESSAGGSIAPPSTLPAPSPSRTAVFTITGATSRASNDAARLVIPRDTSAIDLRIRVNPADRFAVYAVDLRSAADLIIWGDATLRAKTEEGDLIVHAVVPASRVPSGTYDVAIRGGETAAKLEDLGFTQIEVRRKQ